MATTMQAVRLSADWEPKPKFTLGTKDIEGVQTYLGSQVWRFPRLTIEEVSVPQAGAGEVVIEIRQVGICGSDVHMAQPDDDGYIRYPGLTGFPCTVGHEIAGVVVDVGPDTFDKSKRRPYQGGEWVCPEEMVWCGECLPCANGWPNHCERLDEIGFNIDGGFTRYLKAPAKLLWSLDPLRERYGDNDVFRLGSLVEPTSVAYNAVIERAGGIRPGDDVVVCGSGPIGMAAIAILRFAGAGRVILSEPSAERRALSREMGADYTINPMEEDFSERVLEITNGMGAAMYVDAAGVPDRIYPGIERTIWEGRMLNSALVIIGRADRRMATAGEVYQVRRARIVGAQGHSGHGNFPRVIQCMAAGMKMLPMITKEIALKGVPNNIVELRTNQAECKISFRQAW